MYLPRAWVSWSSGKDSAWALNRVRRQGQMEVVGLLTTVTEAFARVSMHGVREEILFAQAEALGLPLHVVRIPSPCPEEIYRQKMHQAIGVAVSQSISRMIFGDLHLQDIRRYREERLLGTGIEAVFPLWEIPPRRLAEEMIDDGLRAWITCLDPHKLPRTMIGSGFDHDFLHRLPEGTDPCGERGEFHTCVSAGPMFSRDLSLRRGETVEREGFLFTDYTLDSSRENLP